MPSSKRCRLWRFQLRQLGARSSQLRSPPRHYAEHFPRLRGGWAKNGERGHLPRVAGAQARAWPKRHRARSLGPRHDRTRRRPPGVGLHFLALGAPGAGASEPGATGSEANAPRAARASDPRRRGRTTRANSHTKPPAPASPPAFPQPFPAVVRSPARPPGSRRRPVDPAAPRTPASCLPPAPRPAGSC